MSLEYEIHGLAEFERAVKANPAYTLQRARLFITRGLAEYRRVILRNPWSIGSTGGGAPVATGHLRDTHQQIVQDLEGRIFPTATYARFIHEGTRKMSGRPWLDYAESTAQSAVIEHERQLLEDVIHQLAT